MYFLFSENKGADQLCDYRIVDLRLCFRICKKLVFSFDLIKTVKNAIKTNYVVPL